MINPQKQPIASIIDNGDGVFTLSFTEETAFPFKGSGETPEPNALELQQIVTHFLQQQTGVKKLILDMENVLFMDTAALGIIHDIQKQLAANGAELALTNPSKDPGETFDIMPAPRQTTAAEPISTILQQGPQNPSHRYSAAAPQARQ